MSPPVCGRIHHGPVKSGTTVCECCLTAMSPMEQKDYIRIRMQVVGIIIEALQFLRSYQKPA